MPNVLNPEPESITLNTELELPTLEPATELEQPPYESTSNTETAEFAVAHDELAALDADALTEPVAEAAPATQVVTEVAGPPEPVAAAAPEVEAAPVHEAHAHETADDFSAALAAFEREQAAEAAAVEAYGDKVVSGTVIKTTE